MSKRGQDLLPVYTLNGTVYIIPAAEAREALPIVRSGSLFYVITNQFESFDIDTEED